MPTYRCPDCGFEMETKRYASIPACPKWIGVGRINGVRAFRLRVCNTPMRKWVTRETK